VILIIDKFIAVHIVPTGLEAQVGGFVGDATPVTNLLAGVCDHVIAHPNVVNGVGLNLARDNVLYVEGFLLDSLFLDRIALRRVEKNKIGVIVDCNLPDQTSLDLVRNTMDAIETNKGVDIVGYELTRKAVGGRAEKTKEGAFVGNVSDVNTYLDVARNLIKRGAQALAIVTYIEIPKKELDTYFKGKGANPYGATEAVISHSMCKELMIPCAHAPLLSRKDVEGMMFKGVVDPRAGAEAMGPAYIGCILQGLHRAPKPVPKTDARVGDITIDDVSAVVTGADCLGGVPMLAAEKRNIPIIAVKENSTVLKVTNDKLRLKNVIVVDNYLEAAGVLMSLKQGISLNSVTRPFKSIREFKR
jgi:hypothetical protein